MSKIPTNPLSVRLGDDERALVEVLAVRKGVPVSMVILRCVRLLGNEVKQRGREWDWIEATAEFSCPPDIMREAETLFAQREAQKRQTKSPDASARQAREEVDQSEREPG